jgi:hypothetical protein
VPRLAIVIAAAATTDALESTLVSVLENRPTDCEIAVALTRPYADPYDLKDEVRFVAPRRRCRPVAAINAAIAATTAPVVHILAAGCQVNEGWTSAPLARFNDRRVASVVPWVFNTADQKLLALGVGYRRRGQRYYVAQGQSPEGLEPPASVIGPALFAAFYRRTALELLGGLSTRLTWQHADADLAIALKQAGFLTAVESASQIWAGSEVEVNEGHLREALSDERLFWRNLEKRTVGTLLSHAAAVAWETLRTLPSPAAFTRLVGRSWASLEMGSHARHRELLTQLAARAISQTPPSGHVRIDRSHERPARSDVGQSTRVRDW